MLRAKIFLVMIMLYGFSWVSNNIQASSTEPVIGYVTAGLFLLATAFLIYLILPVVSRRAG